LRPIVATLDWALTHAGLPWLVRETVQRRAATVLCYHDPAPETLRSHLEFLRSRYEIVSLRDVVGWLEGTRQTLPKKPLAITLDDGWAGNARLAPVFEEAGIVPTIFVCTQVVGTGRRFWWQEVSDQEERHALKQLPDDERLEQLTALGYDELVEFDGSPVALSREDLRETLRWADVQSHTRFHPILPRCDDERAWEEISGSVEDLHESGVADVYALAYPNGDHSDRDEALVRQAGCRCAFTIEPGVIRLGDDRWALPRMTVSDSAGLSELAAKLSGVHGGIRRSLLAAGLVQDRD
jgi:peptidoglycan/xylan/chitin deacetylase (PgdA/CDA1 family)